MKNIAVKKARITINPIGERYGRLVVTAEVARIDKQHRRVICKCDCGKITSSALHHLRGGQKKSCGCLQKDAPKLRHAGRVAVTNLSLEDALLHFSYDPSTGIFLRLIKSEYQKNAGQRADRMQLDGYMVVGFKGKTYRAHRVAWLIVHGKYPDNQIDHINCDRADNRISNLRECCPTENAWNRSISKLNTSGYKGVYFHKQSGKYTAKVTANKRSIELGSFETAEEANDKRTHVVQGLHGEFTRHR